MSIEGNLLKDENILAECKDRDFRFYATNKRVLKYKKGGLLNPEILHDISYNEITGISLEIKRGSIEAVVLGTVILISGIGVYYFGDLIGIYLNNFLTMLLSIVLIACGIAAILAGTLYKRGRFQFKGPGLLSNKEEAEIWRLKEVEKEDVRNFVSIVREELVKREERMYR